jgi:hypothetical protein
MVAWQVACLKASNGRSPAWEKVRAQPRPTAVALDELMASLGTLFDIHALPHTLTDLERIPPEKCVFLDVLAAHSLILHPSFRSVLFSPYFCRYNQRRFGCLAFSCRCRLTSFVCLRDVRVRSATVALTFFFLRVGM